MGSFAFPKNARLLNRVDFVNLNRLGRRFRTVHFTIIVKHNNLENTRLGVTVGKRTGNAVKRNRVKRIIRECFRLNRPHLPRGYDIVVVANKDASHLGLPEITREVGDILFHKSFSV